MILGRAISVEMRQIDRLCWIVSTGNPCYINLTVKGNQVHSYKRDKIFCDGLFRLDTQSVFKQNGRRN